LLSDYLPRKITISSRPASVKVKGKMTKVNKRARIPKSNGQVRMRLMSLSILSMARSEEHTSELQSQSNLVCRLLLEKKKPAKQMAAARQHTAAKSSQNWMTDHFEISLQVGGALEGTLVEPEIGDFAPSFTASCHVNW